MSTLTLEELHDLVDQEVAKIQLTGPIKVVIDTSVPNPKLEAHLFIYGKRHRSDEDVKVTFWVTVETEDPTKRRYTWNKRFNITYLTSVNGGKKEMGEFVRYQLINTIFQIYHEVCRRNLTVDGKPQIAP